MRLSPVLLAVLSATATFGFSNQANGQSLSESLTAAVAAKEVYSSDPESLSLELSPLQFEPERMAQVPETPPDLQPEVETGDDETQLDLDDDLGGEEDVELELETDPQEEEIQLQIEDDFDEDEAQPEEEIDIDVDSEEELEEALDEEVEELDLEPSTPEQPLFPNVTEPTPQPDAAQPGEAEPRVLVSEVDVSGVEGELEDVVYDVVRTQPGRTTTRSQLQEDINAIFATGFFANVQAVPEDTPLGVRVRFVVQPNPILREVQVEGAQVLPPEVVQEAFADQYGEILNLRQLQEGIQTVNEWYQEQGYVLAQVTDAPQVTEDGVVTLMVAEGVIENIEVQFLNAEGQAVDEDGEPVEGRTREFIITREFEAQSGDVFNQQQIERDLQRVFGLGIFEDVRLSLNPGEDPRKVDIVVNVVEGQTGSLAAGVGFSTTGDLFGTVSYQEQNLGGNNQKLGAEFQLSQRELLFDISFTDPWIAGDPYRTSYTVNAFNRRSISLIFDGGEDENEIRLPADEDGDRDRPRIDRLGGGINFTRPLDNGWTTSLGFQYQHVTVRDGDGDVAPVDELGNDLSLSGTGEDDLWIARLAAVRDRRDNPLQPSRGSLLRVGTEQAFPLGQGSAFFNRLRASYSYYIPVDFVDLFSDESQETLAFNVQGGTILGDFPPYEAFSLGGGSSVRGYDEGDLGSGQSFVQATVEYRFPIFSIVNGALFVDAATDLGTGEDVIGNPAGVRGKPGSGFGFGVGVRVRSPLGPIRVDYGINDEGDGRIHFGIGERF